MPRTRAPSSGASVCGCPAGPRPGADGDDHARQRDQLREQEKQGEDLSDGDRHGRAGDDREAAPDHHQGPPTADPNLFEKYPSDGLVPGKGTINPERNWDDADFLRPIVQSLTET